MYSNATCWTKRIVFTDSEQEKQLDVQLQLVYKKNFHVARVFSDICCFMDQAIG